MTRLALSLGLLVTLAACQAAPSPQALACPAGTEPWQRLEFVFGRDIHGGGRVSDQDWQGYVEEVLSPAFPDGLSVVEAEGRWLSSTGERFVEDNFVVFIFLPAEAAAGDRIDRVTANYKSRFQQETVLFSAQPACLAFK